MLPKPSHNRLLLRRLVGIGCRGRDDEWRRGGSAGEKGGNEKLSREYNFQQVLCEVHGDLPWRIGAYTKTLFPSITSHKTW
ncbi:hypothetical protein [Xanthomonas sacchari]|uniref:hypothetical protein n=1 Tax=Xanthomonas sacchari TaxID=56458 RepID=UPI00224F013B|nr:hypothetical protein [Xanthomonas sacchari]